MNDKDEPLLQNTIIKKKLSRRWQNYVINLETCSEIIIEETNTPMRQWIK